MNAQVITHGATVEVTTQTYEIGVTAGVLPITDIYEGSYEITPTASPQTLQTARMFMNGNVVVNPIPQNYGLITWDGSSLMVS